MENQDQRNKSILAVIFFFIQIIIIIIVVSFVSMNTKEDEIGQTEYDRQLTVTIKDIKLQLPDVPYFGPTEIILTKTIELNMSELNTNDSVAIIREGSLKTIKFSDPDSIYFSAIVDIPNLQQSYQIYALYPLDGEMSSNDSYSTQYALCLDDYAEKIYPDFNCKDMYQPNARKQIVEKYLERFDNKDYISYVTGENTIDIAPTLEELDNTTKESYIKQVKENIESLGVSPKMFEYNVVEPPEPDNYT